MAGASLSLLAGIFGTCQCRGVFDCNLPIDSYGGVFLWSALMLYMLRTLYSICDCYFVPSLESIVDKLHIPNDVASWTLVALGSSAPRACVSFIATFLIVDASGVGVVIGSGIFNVLFIVGVTGLVACREGQSLRIWWYPLLRDSFFYGLAVVELLLILADEAVAWHEALLLPLTYLAYGASVRFGGRLAGRLGLAGAPAAAGGSAGGAAAGAGGGRGEGAGGGAEEPGGAPGGGEPGEPELRPRPLAAALRDPLAALLEAAMPAAEARPALLLGLALACVLAATYAVVDSAGRAGRVLNLPPAVVGLSLLAVGTSIPDALGSVAVARQGEGDLAVANALGASVFDIVVGLGGPWTLRCLTSGSITFPGEFSALRWDALLLLSSVLLLILLLLNNRHRLTLRAAAFLVTLYAIYCLYTFVGLFTLRSTR